MVVTQIPSGKESACQCRRCKRLGFYPWLRKILWSRKWQPTPVFLPGKSHGQRSLAGYSPWDHKETDMTECAHARTHTPTHTFTQRIKDSSLIFSDHLSTEILVHFDLQLLCTRKVFWQLRRVSVTVSFSSCLCFSVGRIVSPSAAGSWWTTTVPAIIWKLCRVPRGRMRVASLR